MDETRARELLAGHRQRMQAELAGLEGRPDEAELDEGLAEPLREQLAAIERAVRRVDEGTYGISIESGEPIPDGRLEAVPWAERTAEEQGRYERGL